MTAARDPLLPWLWFIARILAGLTLAALLMPVDAVVRVVGRGGGVCFCKRGAS